ncbi:MAG TPA: biotin-dependent carboxyltransferase family protein [Planctomycetota bacterium]
MTFEVLRPGVLSTLQDLGRPAGQALGFGVAGAMDAFALRVANLLAGNAPGAAALETGLGGLVLRALEDRIVAVCGADLGANVPLWKSARVRAGQELAFPKSTSGVWAYLAVEGGFEADLFLGSASTDPRARRGGFGGRALAKGDVLRARPSKGAREGRGLTDAVIPAYRAKVDVRVILGPQEFSDEAVRTFLSSDYAVTSGSDRMGYRLQGAALATGPAETLSEAVAFGSIQVPADGQPIVLLADRQATGGYAKIATVISADLSKVAQTRPGGSIRFRAVDLEEAQESAVRLEHLLSTVETGCKAP